MNLDRVSEIIERYDADKTASLAMLQDMQAEYGYLPRAALESMARQLDVPLSHVYRLATFFRAFSLNPKGDYVVKVCLGTACHVHGGPAILDELERTLGIKAGNTTPDGKFSLEAVRCVGACALGPMLLMNEEPQGNMTPDKASKMVQDLIQREPGAAATDAGPKAAPLAPARLLTSPGFPRKADKETGRCLNSRVLQIFSAAAAAPEGPAAAQPEQHDHHRRHGHLRHRRRRARDDAGHPG